MARAHAKSGDKRVRQARDDAPVENRTFAIRRVNLKRLMIDMGANKLAKKLGYANASFLSQMAGPNPMRGVTEKTARRFEVALGLPRGWFDVEHDATQGHPAQEIAVAQQPAIQPSVGLTADVIRLVGRLFDEEGVSLSAMRFADVVALAVIDAVEHANEARPDHIRALVRLAKPQ